MDKCSLQNSCSHLKLNYLKLYWDDLELAKLCLPQQVFISQQCMLCCGSFPTYLHHHLYFFRTS